MKRSVRIWILSSLVVLTLALRLVDIWQVPALGIHHPMTQGFVWDVVDGHLTVRQVAERNFDGGLNPFRQGGLRAGDRILEMGPRDHPRPIRGLSDFGQAMREIRRDQPAVLTVERPGQGRLRLDVPTGPAYGLRSGIVFWSWTFLFPFIAILTGFFIGFMRPANDNAFSAALLLLCFSAYFGINHLVFPAALRDLASIYQSLLVGFLPYFFLRFFFLFPSASPLDRWLPSLKHLALGVTLLVVPLQIYGNFLLSRSFQGLSQLQALPRPLLILMGVPPLMFLAGLASLILNTFSRRSPDEKRRLRILLAGTIIGLGPLIAFMTWVSGPGSFSWGLFFLVCTALVVFPLSFAYVVVRHRVLGIQVIIRQGIRYALVSRGFLVVTWLLAFLLFSILASPLINQLFPNAEGIVSALGATLVLLGVQRLSQTIMPLIDRRFFREAYNAQQILSDLSHDVRHLATDPDRLLSTVIERISDSLHPGKVAAFVQGAQEVPVESDPSGRRIRFRRDADSDYRCYWIIKRQRQAVPLQATLMLDERSVQDERFVLRSPSFVPSLLRQNLNQSRQVIELAAPDRRDWSAGDSESDDLAQEFDVLNRLGARLIVPLLSRSQVIGFITLGEKLSEEPYSQQDKQLLLTVAEQTAIALDFSYLIGQAAERQKLKRDVEIAKVVQSNLFPRKLPKLKTLHYAGVCLAAEGVGGDYYDFLSVDQERMCLALGDIAGKGISAALLMASLQALLRARADRHALVSDLISDINRRMCATTNGAQFATFFCGEYCDRTRSLTYVNAGHNPPLFFRRSMAEASRSSVAERPAVQRLECGGLIVGAFVEAEYRQETIRMACGDVLVAYSDGVSEARNGGGEEFGEERLRSIIAENLHLGPEDLCELLVDSVRAFSGEAPQHDDLTLVVAQSV